MIEIPASFDYDLYDDIGAGLAALDPFPECVSTVNFDNDQEV